MRFIEIIEKKRDGHALSLEEINWFIQGYTEGSIPDYQVSALLMAIYFNGMNKEETAQLTRAMLESGDQIDLSGIAGIKCDKHSTGGVGDKTSLALAPMVAACGVKVAKMSGRGLGHTGGTLDKVEAITGFEIELSEEAFIEQVNSIGLALIGQTKQVVPADKKLYALRDVTGTVPSIPLIASSIMSKKLASGADTILLDVKFGEGAFMQDAQQAKVLAKTMIEIGTWFNRDTRAMISDMNQPLGNAIGNALEVKEAVETLQNRGPEDFTTLCLEAGAIMLLQAGVCDNETQAKASLQAVIDDGSALAKLRAMVEAQGGDVRQIDDVSLLPQAKHTFALKAVASGYIADVKALELGTLAMQLGAGRATKEDAINPAVGIVLHHKVGSYVSEDTVLATIHYDHELSATWIASCLACFTLQAEPCVAQPLIREIIRG
ncbi:MAG: pyrimidine-nucleoside phosphorylase [Erysipelotrichaceae bacterium]